MGNKENNIDTDLGLQGKVIIVTGASGGIGKVTSQFLTNCGAVVVRTDIRPSSDGSGLFIPADLSKPEEVDKLFEETRSQQGQLYGIVHCGAIIIRQSINLVDLKSLEREFYINQAGSFFVARKALNVLSDDSNSQGGRIVLFSSQGAFTGGYDGSVTYAMTKAALSALVKSLARMGAPKNITVNLVAPGATDTSMLRNDVSEESLNKFIERIPLGRFGEPIEIASVCAFLLSSWSSFVSGDTIHVNGAQYMA